MEFKRNYQIEITEEIKTDKNGEQYQRGWVGNREKGESCSVMVYVDSPKVIVFVEKKPNEIDTLKQQINELKSLLNK